MQKTAPKIEAEIREKLNRIRGSARGLYHEMRYLIEHASDGRPGELRENGAPMDVEHIAQLAGYSAAKVPPLLDKLQVAGLLKRSGDGVIMFPHVAQIVEVRSRTAERVSRCRVLRNTQKGVTSDGGNGAVTEDPPPEGFPPITPLPNPPSHNNTPASAEAVRPDPEASNDANEDTAATRLRVWIGKQSGFLYSDPLFRNLSHAVEKFGWDAMAGAVATAVANNADEPSSYALRILRNAQSKAAVKRMPAATSSPRTVKL